MITLIFSIGFSTNLKSELDRIGDEVFDVLGTLEALPAGEFFNDI